MKSKNGDLFVYGDFSGMLVYIEKEWYHWTKNYPPTKIGTTISSSLHFIGNTDKILKRLKDES